MKQLINYLEKNKMPSGEEIIEKFDAYRSGILQWNEFVNLTAIRDPEEFTVKHFIDSAACFSLPEYQAAETILDLGTGAGFPGVPLAILSPEKNFVLVDSLNKRLRIIDELCQSIGIKNVKQSTAERKIWAEKLSTEKNTICAFPEPLQIWRPFQNTASRS